LNRITFDFIFCMYMDHDHSPLAIESQGNRSLGFRVSNDGVAVEDSFSGFQQPHRYRFFETSTLRLSLVDKQCVAACYAMR